MADAASAVNFGNRSPSRFQVAVRFKPLPAGSEAPPGPIAAEQPFILLHAGTSQEDVYSHVAAPIVQQIVDKPGSMGVFMCYGQTGSGKTHTIFGPPASLTESSITAPDVAPATWGLFGRSMAALLAAPARERKRSFTYCSLPPPPLGDMVAEKLPPASDVG